MSRIEKLEQQAQASRWAQSGELHDWATELLALGKQLWDEDMENGWTVPPLKRDPQLMVIVIIGANEFARVHQDETGIVGVFGDGRPDGSPTDRKPLTRPPSAGCRWEAAAMTPSGRHQRTIRPILA